jgi:hypothetical protein
MAEMAGALVRARQSLNPVVYLEQFRDFLKKHQTGNRTLLESLLLSLGEDFFVPLAEQVSGGDEAETVRFASVYLEVGDLVRALAPASPLAKRREAEQQVLEGVFREISRRNQAEEAEKKRVVEEPYERLLEARRRDVRSQPEVKKLVRRGIGCAILGALFLAEAVVFTLESQADGALGALFWTLLAFAIAYRYFLRFQKRVEAVQLTAEESAARQTSIKHIEDYFRQKEELERARAVVAVAKGEAPERSFSPSEPELPVRMDVKAIAAGWWHSLALTESGEVYAWGSNGRGQLGLGDTEDRHTPTQVPGLGRVKAIAAGGEHSLALTESGEVYAWGSNGHGQLGLGDTKDRHTPTWVHRTTPATSKPEGVGTSASGV